MYDIIVAFLVSITCLPALVWLYVLGMNLPWASNNTDKAESLAKIAYWRCFYFVFIIGIMVILSHL